MTVQEIRDVCIDSAKNYYDFLAANEKGLQEIEVYELEYLKGRDVMIKLRLASKLFDTDAVFLKLLTNGATYNTGEVKIVEYDSDKNLLLIKPTGEVNSAFANLRARDIKVISDLKFLVDRIRLWYEANGANLNLPTSVSPLKEKFEELSYIKGMMPSENQKASLYNIFHFPFTYVWGAPGTGKTQFVLAYALLHYIHNNKKVAILAPTNNSLEQVMRGVLKIIDKAGIERNRLLRLGTPSKMFAEEYPEVCEEKGVQKNIDEVDKQIRLLERMISYEKRLVNIQDITKQIEAVYSLGAYKEDLSSLQQQLIEQNEKAAAKELEITGKEEAIKNLEQQRSAAIVSVKKEKRTLDTFFSSEPMDEGSDFWAFTGEKSALQQQKWELQEELSKLKVDCDTLKKRIEEAELRANGIIESVQKALAPYPKYSGIVSLLTLQNQDTVKVSLDEAIKSEQDSVEVDGHLKHEYRYYPIEQLQYFLEEAKKVKAKLGSGSTEERLKGVNVVACTLDGYVGRYTDTKLYVEHIFLDEAGYANIIKALTLFNNKVPITLLGDHKQLPPVCEVNDFEIEKEEKYQNVFLWAQSAIYLESLFHKSADEARREYLKNEPFRPSSMTRSALNATFRFGLNLTRVLGRHVYDSQFTSSNPTGETQILYMHASKVEEGKSRMSINEVLAIQRIISALGHEDYVILTPYTKQLKLLGQHLPSERNNLRILTVHGSQGREWRTVILSVVDTHDKWFVDSTKSLSKGLNLVNTAVSRAREQLIIVCDNHYWKHQEGQLITDLIQEGQQLQVNTI